MGNEHSSSSGSGGRRGSSSQPRQVQPSAQAYQPQSQSPGGSSGYYQPQQQQQPLGSPGAVASAPLPVTQPVYVDASSMVFTAPQFPEDEPGGGGGACRSPGPLGSPLSPSRRQLSSATFSSPAIPTYDEHAAMSGITSPVLRSYRQHSFAAAAAHVGSPNTPHSRALPPPFPGAQTPDRPGVPGTGGSGSRLHSPLPPSSLSVPAAAPSSSSGAGAGGPAPLHERFLEITGHPLGLENFGNSCYCNSVIQLLYHCAPLRLRLLELHDAYATKKGGAGMEEGTVLHHLCALFAVMHKSNNRAAGKKASSSGSSSSSAAAAPGGVLTTGPVSGTPSVGGPARREMISPKSFLACVQRHNALFNNQEQHDAHEFIMFVLNEILETERKIMADPRNRALLSEGKKKKSGALFSWKGAGGGGGGGGGGGHTSPSSKSRSSGGKGGGGGHPHPSPPARDDAASAVTHSSDGDGAGELTPLQAILQGRFVSLTACLECGAVSERAEPFYDVSLETRQGCSLLHCLHHFGDPEYFYGTNTLRCDACARQVRAARSFHVQQLPHYALLMHLKRFRYDPARGAFTKKADHVALSLEMDVEEFVYEPDPRAPSLSGRPAGAAAAQSREGKADDAAKDGKEKEPPKPLPFKPAPQELRQRLRGVARHKARFALTGFVAHIGEGANLGHYFTCVRYGRQLWRRFDDDLVTELSERDIEKCFGVPIDVSGVVTTTAYILLYERVA